MITVTSNNDPQYPGRTYTIHSGGLDYRVFYQWDIPKVVPHLKHGFVPLLRSDQENYDAVRIETNRLIEEVLPLLEQAVREATQPTGTEQ